jgi:hypothetical protein
VTAQLARALAAKGARVGVLDADISSPAIPTLLGSSSSLIMHSKEGWVPAKTDDNISVMSIDYLIPAEKREEALLWHDSRKIDILRQFIDNVHWGELDYLIIDCRLQNTPCSFIMLKPFYVNAYISTFFSFSSYWVLRFNFSFTPVHELQFPWKWSVCRNYSSKISVNSCT